MGSQVLRYVGKLLVQATMNIELIELDLLLLQSEVNSAGGNAANKSKHEYEDGIYHFSPIQTEALHLAKVSGTPAAKNTSQTLLIPTPDGNALNKLPVLQTEFRSSTADYP